MRLDLVWDSKGVWFADMYVTDRASPMACRIVTYRLEALTEKAAISEGKRLLNI